MLLRVLLSIALAILFSANALSQELWIATGDSVIGIVDVASGNTITSKTISNQEGGWRGIAFSPERELFGTSGTSLYRIDFEAGTSEEIGRMIPVGFGTLGDLIFGTDGTLYSGRGFSGNGIETVNTLTGEATPLLDSFGISGAGGMAFIGDDLFQSVVIDTLFTGNRLATHDLTTSPPTSELIDNAELAALTGLASPDRETLYGIFGSDIVAIDPLTGSTTAISSFDGDFLGGTFRRANGFAFSTEASAVPEPAGALFLIIAGFPVIWRRRRKY